MIFLPTWNALWKRINVFFKIDHKQFIITVDEEKYRLLGCSMDSLNCVMREIEAEYQLEFSTE